MSKRKKRPSPGKASDGNRPSEPFAIVVAKDVVKFLDSQDRKSQQALKSKIEKIAIDPLDIQNSKWLAGHEKKRVARVGHTRIVFTIDLEQRKLTISKIDSRGQVYSRI